MIVFQVYYSIELIRWESINIHSTYLYDQNCHKNVKRAMSSRSATVGHVIMCLTTSAFLYQMDNL